MESDNILSDSDTNDSTTFCTSEIVKTVVTLASRAD